MRTEAGRFRWRRLRSLRYRALIVVVIVVVAPLSFVWLSDFSDASAGVQLKLRVRHAASTAAGIVERQHDVDRGLDDLAARHGVRIRLVAADGRVLVDRDHEPVTGLLGWFGSAFFGPDGAPSLQEWDARQPPLGERAEIAGALEAGVVSSCQSTEAHKLLVCEAVQRVELADGSVAFVHVQESSRRAIRALYDLRYQLAKLTLFVLGLGLAIGWWLGWRLVRPVERLRRQVLDRERTASLAPVPVERDDEFGDLAVAFNDLLRALSERNQANEGFAADLVHEIKNPVAAVRAASAALEADRPLDRERALRLARVLRESSDRLDALASRFLDLARAEAGLSRDQREAVDLAALARGVVETARSDARYEAVTFSLSAEAPAVVVGVPERLETALRNLVDNAAHHAREQHPEGGHVTVEVSASGGQVLSRVADDGPGIPPEDLPRVFDRFFSRRHGGTGLGLALSRAIVLAHGGTITAQNDGGAVFEIRLPGS